MPAIIKDNKQVKALSEISEALEVMRNLNFLLAENTEGAYFLSSSPKGGKKIRIALSTDDNAKVAAILTSQRTRLIKEIRAKSKKFRIDLDDEETALLKSLSGINRNVEAADGEDTESEDTESEDTSTDSSSNYEDDAE